MAFEPKFQASLDWIDSRQDAMLQQTIALAEVNSGSLNADGVNRVGEMLAEHCQRLGGQVEVVPVAPYRYVSGQGNVETSAKLIAEAAERVHLGMIYEPSFPDGNLNGQRDGVTINPGYIEGGGPVNIVPDLCVFRFNIRLERAEDEAWCQAQLDHLLAATGEKDGTSVELHGGFGRKPKQLSPVNLLLFELARECGNRLGMSIEHKPTGGCCDGNNLAAAGIPNIDTLGVQGGAIHSSDEYLKVDSLVQRAKLSALMLMELATSPDLGWLGVN